MFNYLMFVNMLPAKFQFKPMEFVHSLKYMFSGMLAIIIVIAVIILFTVIINKIFSKK